MSRAFVSLSMSSLEILICQTIWQILQFTHPSVLWMMDGLFFFVSLTVQLQQYIHIHAGEQTWCSTVSYSYSGCITGTSRWVSFCESVGLEGPGSPIFIPDLIIMYNVMSDEFPGIMTYNQRKHYFAKLVNCIIYKCTACLGFALGIGGCGSMHVSVSFHFFLLPLFSFVWLNYLSDSSFSLL